MVSKLSDVPDTLRQAVDDPQQSFPAILKLARSEDWKEREVAAPILVEASKKKPEKITREMTSWADHPDPNVRRAASEGLRGVARKNPELVLPVIRQLRADENSYVKKSVANVLRNGQLSPRFRDESLRRMGCREKSAHGLDYQGRFEEIEDDLSGES